MADWLHDVRYCLRGFAKKPGFAAAVLMTLALCIGLNTCIFTFLHTILVQDLPFRDPDRLVSVWTILPAKIAAVVGNSRNLASYPNFDDWKAQSQVVEGMSAFTMFFPITVTGEGDPEQVESVRVCDQFFQVLGVQPMLGRAFLREEHADGKDRVVIVSHRYWQSRLGSDRHVVGRTILLDQVPHTVVGVLPESFTFGLTFGRMVDGEPELWRPRFRGEDDRSRGSGNLYPIARLKPGITLERANAEMSLIATRLAKQYPQTNEGYGAEVSSLHETLRGRHRPLLIVLMAAATMVLLIGCANVANLLITRSIAREKEFAVRSSLGASRARLIRQLLTEGLVFALTGGALGLGLAAWASLIVDPLLHRFVRGIPEFEFHLPILLFNLGISLFTAVTFSLAPLFQISRLTLSQQLKEGTKAVSGRANRKVIPSLSVVGQVALASVLLIGGTLLARSFLHLWTLHPGFRSQGLIMAQVPLTGERYAAMAQRQMFYEELLEGVSALPGIEAAALTSHPTHARRGGTWGFSLQPSGFSLKEIMSRGELPHADYQMVSAEYFRTAGIPLRRGRLLTPADTRSLPPVMVINETMARKYWKNQDPVGQKIYLSDRANNVLTVVGVVADVRQRGLQEETVPHMYWSNLQRSNYRYYLLIRAKIRPEAVLSAIRNQVRMLDPSQYARISLVEDELHSSIESPRLVLLLFGIFAVLALGLSLLGLYGLMSYLVSESTREIGIRMALGATQARVLASVLGYGFRRVIAGLVVGLALAAGLTRLLSSQLFGVTAVDPVTFTAIPLVLALFGLLSCYIPANRAACVDPIRSLRAD
ncbi:MAG: ABC transporter permease [Acidobacteria bacterium]|nr:MAG: ABC transporter permease [Acidobacteriota bacterium]